MNSLELGFVKGRVRDIGRVRGEGDWFLFFGFFDMLLMMFIRLGVRDIVWVRRVFFVFLELIVW